MSLIINSKEINQLIEFPKESWIPDVSSPILPDKPFHKAFQSLSKTIRDFLYSCCKPGIYIFSGDAGSGKSTTVHTEIKYWKDGGFRGGGSAIIFLSTLDEVDSYVKGCGLDLTDYACISSDSKRNRYGLGRDKAAYARVIFTTHEQYRRRVAETGNFERIEAFHYNGKPRSLRIWDEGFNPAVPVSISLDVMDALPNHLSKISGCKELVDILRNIRIDSYQRKVGAIISIPMALEKAARDLLKRISMPVIPRDAIAALTALVALAGLKAVVKEDRGRGLALVGRGQRLPDDLAPLIVLDASARIRPTYRIWSESDDRVVMLPAAIADYSDLQINWYNRGAGKSSLADPAKRASIVGIAARLINSNREPWLVILQGKMEAYGDKPGFCITSEITDADLIAGDRVKFLTWGRHLASNEYRTIRNVLVIGSNDYPYPQYAAMHIAATGQLVEVEQQQIRNVAAAEAAHHIYQAVSRSNLRQMDHEKAGRANVYIIASDRVGKVDAVKQAFKGCAIVPWEPVGKKPTKKQQGIMDTILSLMDDHICRIETKTIWQALDGNNDYLRGIWSNDIIKEFLSLQGIEKVGNSLIKTATATPTMH